MTGKTMIEESITDGSMTDGNMSKLERSLSALMAAFLLAIIHQYLFYGKMAGVSYPIFVSLFYVFMLYYAKGKMRKPTGFSYLWLGCILLLSLTFALFQNPFFRGLNQVVVPVLILLHMTYMLNKQRPSWSQGKLIDEMFEQLFPQSFRHWPTVLKIIRNSGGRSMKKERKQVLIKVLIGLAISFPLLLVVVTLLSSADGVFHHALAELPNWLNRFSFDEGFVRGVWIVALGTGIFGFLWGFIDPKAYDGSPERKAGEAVLAPVSFKLDPVITTTILIAVNIVYVLFVVVQFSYLFGAWEGVLPTGSSYADYARSGFFELITVTSINFVILLLALVSGEHAKGLLHKIISVLLYILVGCSTVMLYSAYTRLALYEEAYGHTYIRFLVHAFMIFLGLLLIIAALRIGLKRLPLAKCYIVLGLLSYVLMNYIGMDVIIVNKNIERYEDSGKLDAEYLFTLAPEAIPSLIEFSRKDNRMLDSYLQKEWSDAQQKERKWPSFNISDYRSQRALEKYFQE